MSGIGEWAKAQQEQEDLAALNAGSELTGAHERIDLPPQQPDGPHEGAPGYVEAFSLADVAEEHLAQPAPDSPADMEREVKPFGKESSSNIPLTPPTTPATPARHSQPEQPRQAGFLARHKKPIASAVGAAVVIGGIGGYFGTKGSGHTGRTANNHPVAAQTNANPSHKRNVPADNNTAPVSSDTKPSTSQSETSPANAAENLATAQPLIANYSDSAPYGSAEVIQTLYKDLQLADQTGRLDFLEAVLGNDLTTPLAVDYTKDVTQFQQYFQQHPDQLQSYTYKATNIRHDTADPSKWYVISVETAGDNVQKNAQTITLSTRTGLQGQQHWVLQSVEAVPIS